MNSSQLEKFLSDQIPLTKALGVEVREANSTQAVLFAPLEPNRNHLGTAFGGSLAATLILAGYTWLYSYLEQEGHASHVLLKGSQTNYLHPVEQDFIISCRAPAETELNMFMEAFIRKGVARIFLESEIVTDYGRSATFRGEFVAKKSDSGLLG